MMVLLVEKRNVLKMRIHYDTVCNALYFIECYINKSRGIRTKSNPMGIKTIDKTNPMIKCFIKIHQEAEQERNYTGKNVF